MDDATFDRQISEMVKAMELLLRAGYNVRQLFELLGPALPDPLGAELRAIKDDVDAGRTWPEALEGWTQRNPSALLAEVVGTFLRQRVEGGNLADKLEKLYAAFVARAGSDAATAAAREKLFQRIGI